ncbi:MAG: hypothetical protein R2939_11110 [Kofleriaceae bacterium]
MRNLLALASALWIGSAACTTDGDDKGGGLWTPGKGDGNYDVVEAGPAPKNGVEQVDLDHRVKAYRVEAWGNMELSISAAGARGVDAYVVVEGPLADHGDGVGAGAGAVVADDDDSGPGRDAQLDLTLAEPGVYRILVTTADSVIDDAAPEGEVALKVTCNAGCDRPEMDNKTFVETLRAAGGPALAAAARDKLTALIPDPALAATLGAQLDAILADPDLTGLERFPTIPMDLVDEVRPLLGSIEAPSPAADAVITGDLKTLLGPCTPTRAVPKPVDANLPGVGFDGWADFSLSPCQAAHAPKLAEVMTALAADNGSEVTYRGKALRTPTELIDALVDSGHQVEVRNERMYANFIALSLGEASVIWPVWIDTGVALSSGESLTVPVGHSHHAWRISGPEVNTRVMFYLGPTGVYFYGQTGRRPTFSGTVVAEATSITYADDVDRPYLRSTLDTAAAYLRRLRLERDTVAAGLPGQGYGYLGVCNDSNAALELATRGTISTFPLFRAAELDDEADLGDDLDDVLRALPKDGDGVADAADLKRRALAMQPFAAGAPQLAWDAVLDGQLATLAADVGE